MTMGDLPARRPMQSIAVMIRSHLWVQIIVAMVAGLGIGFMLSPEGGALIAAETSLALASWLKLPGTVFLNMIQMVVIPLVTSSIILGICSSGDPAYLKRVGLRIFPYFVFTTTVAVTIGILLALTIKPGDFIDQSMILDSGLEVAQELAPAAHESISIPDRIAGFIPTNIEEARLTRDMLQIVIYAIIGGIAMMALPRDRVQPLLDIVEAIQDISLRIVSWAMLLAPWAVFGLLADVAIRVGVDAIFGMSVYVGTVMLGLLLLLVFYLLVVTTFTRKHPLSFLVSIRDVQLLAFSTSSSAAVIPLSLETAEKKLGVKPEISKFIIPLGATINMDGTALYQVVAALFLTQVYGIDLTAGQILVLTMTTVGASIGSPSTPGVGIVILATILVGIGVPAEGIALIIGVDRILDMCRTAINVSGDLTACVVMDRWLEED